MSKISYFFRVNESINGFIPFHSIHLLLLCISVIGCIYILKFKRSNRIIELIVGCTLLIQQIVLYSWYILTHYNTISDGLPLYHCRIAILSLALGLIFKKDFLIKVGSYWGILGSISALVVVNLDKFSFPHLTQFSYFIGHIFLLWGVVYTLFVKKIGMTKKDFRNIILFTTLYHITMYFLNPLTNSNYGYMANSPISITSNLSHPLYAVVVILTFNFVLLLEFILNNKQLFKPHFKKKTMHEY